MQPKTNSASAAMPAEMQAIANEVYPLVVGNRTLTTFRVGLLSYSSKDRVDAAQLRLERILESTHGKVTAMPVPSPGQGMAIMLDGQVAFTIQPGDVNELVGETMDSMVETATAQLNQVIEERRERRNPQQLLIAVLYTVLATAIFLASFWVLNRARRVLLSLGHRYLTVPIAKMTKRTVGVKISILNRCLHWLVNFVLGLLLLSLVYTWVSFVFYQFPFTRAWSENLNNAILDFLAVAGLGVLNAIPGLLVVVFILICARYISRFMNFMFSRIERGELNLGMFDRDTASTTRRILSFLVWLLAIAMIYPYLPGANTDAFKGLSVMVGLMISLGASSVVGQFASGLILIYAKSLKQGEYVQIGGTEGTVSHIGLFATKIHTNLREEVSIPNSVLVGQNVINFSRLAAGGGVISQVVITIGYDVAWRQVEAMLLEAARGTAGVRRDPAPRVFQTALSDWYVEYHLRVALDEPRRRLEILNDLHGKVQDVFNTYGVQIMSPNYIADPASDKLVPVDKWYPAPAKKN
ncbi:mechanosensitive ion channel family protein [Deefgea tanakiae]|uniref:Small-conductance mechanosensitive channel n=1 Tax=Deefgea tanakiae TaxID=2865840 RepID=A0ABX8Z5B4_9NEIS|nr:mechanosensitive ion channel family protein [Deefgea tanakiae]QZA77751.1 mechanosensitive ion channel family protein [Deefgea tanakiae]